MDFTEYVDAVILDCVYKESLIQSKRRLVRRDADWQEAQDIFDRTMEEK